MQRKAQSKIITEFGKFEFIVYEDSEKRHHIALVKKPLNEPVLVRVHSECITSEVFHSRKCDCNEQLETAMNLIGKKGGILIYLRQEGRGIGIVNKIKAYALQEQGMDTVEANEKLGLKVDARDYSAGVKILSDLGVNKIRLLTNNPKKIEGLERYGIEIVERLPLQIEANCESRRYLRTKKEKLGHLLEDKGFC